MPSVFLIYFPFKDVEKGEKIDEPSTSSKANVPRKKKIKEVCYCPLSIYHVFIGISSFIQPTALKFQMH